MITLSQVLPLTQKRARQWVRINPKRSLIEYEKLKAEYEWFGFTPTLNDLASRLVCIGTQKLKANE